MFKKALLVIIPLFFVTDIVSMESPSVTHNLDNLESLLETLPIELITEIITKDLEGALTQENISLALQEFDKKIKAWKLLNSRWKTFINGAKKFLAKPLFLRIKNKLKNLRNKPIQTRFDLIQSAQELELQIAILVSFLNKEMLNQLKLDDLSAFMILTQGIGNVDTQLQQQPLQYLLNIRVGSNNSIIENKFCKKFMKILININAVVTSHQESLPFINFEYIASQVILNSKLNAIIVHYLAKNALIYNLIDPVLLQYCLSKNPAPKVITEFFEAYNNPNITSEKGLDALMCTIIGKSENVPNIINTIISKGSPETYLNQKTLENKNIIHLAAIHSSPQILSSLLSKFYGKPELNKAINHKDTNGLTPLDIAIRNEDGDKIAILLSYGADLNLINKTLLSNIQSNSEDIKALKQNSNYLLGLSKELNRQAGRPLNKKMLLEACNKNNRNRRILNVSICFLGSTLFSLLCYQLLQNGKTNTYNFNCA